MEVDMKSNLDFSPKLQNNNPFLDNLQFQIQVTSNFSKHSVKHFKVEHLLQLLARSEVQKSMIEPVAKFFQYLLQRNRRLHTIESYFQAIKRLMVFLKSSDISRIENICRDDLGAFIEYLQDNNLMPSTINSYLTNLYTFFGFLIETDQIDPKIMRHKFRLKMPDELPKAIDPEDIKQIISMIDTPRERALIMVLLRTGMRIGELLRTKIMDISLSQRKINIYQAQKNYEGRVVYMSDDACNALQDWIEIRKLNRPYVFYGRGDRKRLSYCRARQLFIKYIQRAELSHKGYTLHCLRHTFASELLNAGMRLECLQVLLGHQNIEVTRRYARLTDTTRKKEYFKAMERIERGEINGHYRFHN